MFQEMTQRLQGEEGDRAIEQTQPLEQRFEELQRLHQLKENFLATVSYELRKPLSNIQLTTRVLSIALEQLEILAREAEPSPSSASRYIKILQRIVSELLQDACDYTPHQERTQVQVGILKPNEDVVLSHILIQVFNSGIEIAADKLERIFNPFYRIPQRDRWTQEGLGLGLALVKELAAHLGGSVVATS